MTFDSACLQLSEVGSSAGVAIIADTNALYTVPDSRNAARQLNRIGHEIERLAEAHRAAVEAFASHSTKAA